MALTIVVLPAYGQDNIAVSDSIPSADLTKVATDSIAKRPNLIQRIINYFDDSNREHPDKKFDITFLGGPSYSASTSLQIAAVAAGLYRTSRAVPTSESNISVFAQGSVTGFYRVGVKGNHFSPGDSFRMKYQADFAHFPLKFWGLNFENQYNDDNESDYTELQSVFWGEFQWRLYRHLYLGPSFNFNYGKATRLESPWLWEGENPRIFSYGFGFVLSIDTRDYATNASCGYNIELKQKFFPKAIGNKDAFSSTEFTASIYHKFWSSGIMAFQLHGWGTYGNPPWTMLPTLDESNSIRSYYEGRYRAKNEIDAVVELRQHIWRRNGLVVWAGLGTVFDHFHEINGHRLLPSYGIGYRWEFKKRVNVRVDFGMGKHSHAIGFGLNETF